jgi:hypothetical protein
VKVFISWSGPRSRAAAGALRRWLQGVFHTIEPWMSEKDIMAGALWLNEIMNGLKDARFAIVCITPENQMAPWLHFEAGAIAKQVIDTNYVCPYLISLNGTQFRDNPLTNFQYKQADKKGTKELVETINQLLDKPLEKDILEKTFAYWWPELESDLKNLPEPNDKQDVSRSVDSMVQEMLGLVREMARSTQFIPGKIERIMRIEKIPDNESDYTSIKSMLLTLLSELNQTENLIQKEQIKLSIRRIVSRLQGMPVPPVLEALLLWAREELNSHTQHDQNI